MSERGFLKPFLFSFLPLAVLFSGISLVIFFVETNAERKLSEQSEFQKVQLLSRFLERDLDNISSDIRSLAGDPHTPAYFSSPSRDKAQLKFSIFLNSKKRYHSLSAYDSRRKILTRFVREASGRFPATASIVNRKKSPDEISALERKSASRPDGIDFIAHKRKKTENSSSLPGDVSRQYRLSIISGVNDARGRRLGFLLLEFDLAYFKNLLNSLSKPESSGLILLRDEDGRILAGTPGGKSDINPAKESILRRIFKTIPKNEKLARYRSNRGIYTISRLSGKGLPAWTVLSFEDGASIRKVMLAYGAKVGALYLVLLLLGFLGSYFLAKIRLHNSVSRRDLSFSEKRFSTLFNNSPLGIIHADANGQTLECNPSARRLLNLTHPHKSKIDLFSLKILKESGLREDFKLALINNEIITNDIPLDRPGEHMFLRYILTPILTRSDSQEMLIVFEDITFFILWGQEQGRARRKAEDANRAKSYFLTSMSHEIRTPLNAILGLTDLMLAMDGPEEQNKMLQIVKSSGNLLLHLLNDSLELSRIESGAISISRERDVEPREIVSRVSNLFKGESIVKNIEIRTEFDDRIPETLFGDPHRLEQILINLVSNSLKFTRKGGVSIQAELEKKTPPAGEDELEEITIRFRVLDSGVGIPEESLPAIFDMYYRGAEERNMQYRGAGVGTTICRRIVELWGGRIDVLSPAIEHPFETGGPGTEFWFSLPFTVPRDSRVVSAGKSSDPEFAPKAYSREGTILIVEDDEINRSVLSAMLRKMGAYDIFIAVNGAEALGQFASRQYDLILMDIQMPLMDGLEATRRLRELEKDSRVPIVAVTAYSFQEDVDKCFAAGMDDYLAKPCNMRDLQCILGKWLPLGADSARESD